MKVPTVAAVTVGDAQRCVARFGYEPRTVGVPLLPPDAGEAAWLERRRTMVTASEVAALLGKSSYESAFSLWWKKQPNWPASPRTVEQHIGHKLESVIGELWAEAHPEAALFRSGAALWGHCRHEWLGATPDYIGVFPTGLERDPDGPDDGDGEEAWGAFRPNGVRIEPVECKSDEGGDGWGRAGTDEVPEHHLCQVLTQCMVLGANRGRIVRLAAKRVTEYIIDVDQHTALCGEIIEAGRPFVASLTAGVPPDIDGHAATETTLRALYTDVFKGTEVPIPDEMADAYTEALGHVSAWTARLNEIKNRLREELGRESAQYAVRGDGTRVASRSVYTRNGYTVGPAQVDQIRPLKRRGGGDDQTI